MKKIVIYSSIVIITATLASLTTKCVLDKKKGLDKKNVDTQILLGMLYQQKAAEYKALCLQAYNLATRQVDEAIQSGQTDLAVITDLDETALDNSEGEAFSYVNDRDFDKAQFQKWALFGKAAAVPGAVEFFQYAASKGVDIYYLSNRPSDPAIVKSTMKNMQALGFPYSHPGEEAHFLFRDDSNGLTTKEPRRRKVSDTLKKNVIVLLGDNLIDINTAFDQVNMRYLSAEVRQKTVDNFRNAWGSKYIILPNAYYGDWEKCLYNNTSDLSYDQKNEIRQTLLNTLNYTGN